MDLTALKRLTAIWQERLKLLDWDVKVRWATPEEVTGSYGLCNYEHETKEVEIVITHPKDYSDEDKADRTKDPEVFIVHELSHLHLLPFDAKSGSLQETVEENVVNLFSRLLVAVDRRDDEITGRKLSKRASLKVKKGRKSNAEICNIPPETRIPA